MAKRVYKSLPKKRGFNWTEQRELAASLLAQDELSDEAIAQKVGITRQGLAKWKAVPEFAARVESIVDDARKAIRKRGISIIENRVKALQDRWKRMQRIIDERAADPDMQGVPGGGTGLLAHDVKSVGAGVTAERVDVYALDAALLKELREHEKQAAQELGQHTEKHEHSGPNGGPIRNRFDLSGFSTEELLRLERAFGGGTSGTGEPGRN